MSNGLKFHRKALLRLAAFGIAASLLAAPAWAQATSAGAPKVDKAVSAAADAVPADGPATLLIKKKKKKVVSKAPVDPATAPVAVAPEAAPVAAAADQPPVPLDGAKAADPATAATVADTATPAAVAPTAPAVEADAAVDPLAAARKKKKMTKKDGAKPASATADAATAPAATVATAKPAATVTAATAVVTKKAAAVADPAAKPVRKAASASPDTPPSGATGCRTRAFTVNDYGKDGPTSDAKRLLDADIASWTKANNLSNVSVGAKSVKCFQYLNFVVFDEWTCTASAKVCWK